MNVRSRTGCQASQLLGQESHPELRPPLSALPLHTTPQGGLINQHGTSVQMVVPGPDGDTESQGHMGREGLRNKTETGV